MLHVTAITLVAFAMAPALWRFTQSTISGSGKNFKRGRLWVFLVRSHESQQDRSRQPYDWTRLRDRWERSHLARGAGTPKLAACGLTVTGVEDFC